MNKGVRVSLVALGAVAGLGVLGIAGLILFFPVLLLVAVLVLLRELGRPEEGLTPFFFSLLLGGAVV